MKKLLLTIFFVFLLQNTFNLNGFFSPSEYYISPIKQDKTQIYLKEYEEEYFGKDKLLKDFSGSLRDKKIDEIFNEIDAKTIYLNTLKYKIKLSKKQSEKDELIQINNDHTDRLSALYKLLGEKEGLCFDENDKACIYTQNYLNRKKKVDTHKIRGEYNAELKELFTITGSIYNLYVKNQDKFILTSSKEVDLWDFDSELDGFVLAIKSVNANLKYTEIEKQAKKQEYKNLYFNELKPAIKETEINNFSSFLDKEIEYITTNSSNSKLLKKDYYYLSNSFRNNLTKKIEKIPLETRTLYIGKILTQVDNAIVKETKLEKRKVYRELKKFLQKELTKTLEILGKL